MSRTTIWSWHLEVQHKDSSLGSKRGKQRFVASSSEPGTEDWLPWDLASWTLFRKAQPETTNSSNSVRWSKIVMQLLLMSIQLVVLCCVRDGLYWFHRRSEVTKPLLSRYWYLIDDIKLERFRTNWKYKVRLVAIKGFAEGLAFHAKGSIFHRTSGHGWQHSVNFAPHQYQLCMRQLSTNAQVRLVLQISARTITFSSLSRKRTL